MKGLVKFLVFAAVLFAPILVSPALRAELGASLPAIGDQLFPENFWRDMAIGMAVLIGVMALMYAVLWLNDRANSYPRGGPKSRDLFYPGWKRTFFIAASLLLFLAASGVWVLGLVAVSQHAAELAPDGYGLSVFMMILAIFGILVLALAKPAYWAVRIMINR